MARYRDIFNAIEYATNESCPNRLLAFAKVRSVALSGAAAAHSTARQIINRFCNVALENQQNGLWSLDLLHMCTLHGGDSFALALNSQDRLNDLLAFFLNPIKTKSVSVQIQLKLLSLIQNWAITYKNVFSCNNFEHAYERLKKSGVVTNVDGVHNLHWLPDRDVFGNFTESAPYDLQDVVSEISTENKILHAELQTIFQMVNEEQSSNSKKDVETRTELSEASKRTLEIRQAVYASQAFWNDIIEHLETKPEDLNEINLNIQCIFESMEQSITCCIKALKADPAVKAVEDKAENEVGRSLDGFHKEEKPLNTDGIGPELKTDRSVKSRGFWSCALCNLRFDDRNRLLNHIEAPDHQRQLENRMFNKTKSPPNLSLKPAKEKENQTPKSNSTLERKERAIFNPHIEVRPKSPIVFSEPYVPLNLDKSPTTPPATATEIAENSVCATPGCRPTTLTKPKIYTPHVSVTQIPQVNRLYDNGYIRTSTRSNIIATKSGGDSFRPLEVGNLPRSEGTMLQSEPPKRMETSVPKRSEVKELVSKQMQTETRDSAGLLFTSSRPINVQCNDCRLTFSNLDKLLSHPCHVATLSTGIETGAPLLPTLSYPHPPPVQVVSQLKTNNIALFFCEDCGLDFDEKHLFEAHLRTPRHEFSAGHRGAANQNTSVVFRKLSQEQIEKASSLTFGHSSYSTPKLSHENANNTNRVGYPLGQMYPSQNPLIRVKAVETTGAHLYGSVERSMARPMGGSARQIPEYSVQSGVTKMPQESNITLQSETLQGMNLLIQKHNITTRGDLFFCNACFVYLHNEEIIEHIACVDHQQNIGMGQKTAALPSSQEVNESTKPVLRMPSLPPLYSTNPTLPDANYIAVYVPAEQAIEGESGRRPIFTQYVSLGSPRFPTLNAPVGEKGVSSEGNTVGRRLL
ncbi:zinc finger C2H2 type [Echinococcus multilocularis]|uniref:Zinc finger C2H2 type n=1 Tax=Echinococcus multilocularis TaxID=6211 RepID=A0A068Y2S3_ECHMU|nr:zinc finger C2H2 type [Echinococcus multilocularis]